MMEELKGTTKAIRENKQQFYSELIYIADQKRYARGWASHKYKEKFGVWPRGLNETPSVPSVTTTNWVKHKQIAWSKRINKGVR
jgi:hypothetical protein